MRNFHSPSPANETRVHHHLPVPFSIKNTFLCVGPTRTVSGEFHFQHKKRASCPPAILASSFPSSYPDTHFGDSPFPSAEPTDEVRRLVNESGTKSNFVSLQAAGEGKNPGPFPAPSLGSKNHGRNRDLCNPCGFFRKKSGCTRGDACIWCHLCVPKQWRGKRGEGKKPALAIESKQPFTP